MRIGAGALAALRHEVAAIDGRRCGLGRATRSRSTRISSRPSASTSGSGATARRCGWSGPRWQRETEHTADTLAGLERRLELAHEAETRHEASMSGLRAAIEAAREREAALGARADRVPRRARLGHRAGGGPGPRGRPPRPDGGGSHASGSAQARDRRAQLDDRSRWLEAEQRRADEAAREAAAERDRGEGAVRAAAAAARGVGGSALRAGGGGAARGGRPERAHGGPS